MQIAQGQAIATIDAEFKKYRDIKMFLFCTKCMIYSWIQEVFTLWKFI